MMQFRRKYQCLSYTPGRSEHFRVGLTLARLVSRRSAFVVRIHSVFTIYESEFFAEVFFSPRQTDPTLKILNSFMLKI